MYMYTYVHMYICTYVHMYICTYVHMCIIYTLYIGMEMGTRALPLPTYVYMYTYAYADRRIIAATTAHTFE